MVIYNNSFYEATVNTEYDKLMKEEADNLEYYKGLIRKEFPTERVDDFKISDKAKTAYTALVSARDNAIVASNIEILKSIFNIDYRGEPFVRETNQLVQRMFMELGGVLRDIRNHKNYKTHVDESKFKPEELTLTEARKILADLDK